MNDAISHDEATTNYFKKPQVLITQFGMSIILFGFCVHLITVIYGQECGEIYSERLSSDRIVGGLTVQDYTYPWFAMLSTKIEPSPVCAGALISPYHVLTAAHCFDQFAKGNIAEQLVVSLGVSNWCENEKTRQKFEISAVDIHERYQGVEDFHDIAILHLKQRANFATVCLPKTSARFNNQQGIIAGWGRLAESRARLPCNLQQAKVERYTMKVCANSRLPRKDVFEPTVFCGGGENIDTCQGDSGGPFLTVTQNDKYVVTGIVSSGYGCARPGFPGLYTNVGSYLEWISDKTGGKMVNVEGAKMLIL